MLKPNRYILLTVRLFLNAVRNRKLTFRKIWNFMVCNFAYALKLNKSGNTPLILNLELMNECNAGCLFCRNDKGVIYNSNPEKPLLGSIAKGKMPAEMAINIIQQLMDELLVAVLYTNGEPLLYKDLARVIEFCTTHGVATLISSNGLLLNTNNAKAILDAGIDCIKIQLSGFSQDIYSIQVRNGNVEKLKENIRMLVRLKNEGKYNTIIFIDYIQYDYNRHQIPLVRSFCRELGITMNIRPGNPFGGLEKTERPQSSAPLPLDISCDWLWKAIQVNFNGEVLQCCDGVVFSGISPIEIYSTNQTDLRKVWNGEIYQQMRKNMTNYGRKVFPICAKCQRKGIYFKY